MTAPARLHRAGHGLISSAARSPMVRLAWLWSGL